MPPMTRRCLRLPAIVLLAGLTLKTSAAAASGVQITESADRLKIEINGQALGDYVFKGASRPYLYPLIGPGGIALTRRWPMEQTTDEEMDHPHHRSFWYAHGDVNGHDFWSEAAKAGQTVHEAFLEVKSGPDAGVIRSKNKLVAKDGTVVATDERTLRIHARTDCRMLDFEITVHASNGAVNFGDTKEGAFGIRLAETMRLKPNKFNAGKPTGHIINSEGVKDGETWGKRAKWVDYYGPVQGKTLGVAILDHPSNPRHPTWWHVRDYGLFAVNPFGIHDFEKKPAGAGDLKLAAGEKVTFRYRVILHTGDEKEGRVAEHFEQYARTPAQP